MLEMSLEEARDHCRKKGIVISPLNSFTQDYCYVYTFFLLLGNFSDVLTVQDDEESRFFLKEMWHFYQGPQNLWLGIIYDIDSKIYYCLFWRSFKEYRNKVRQVSKMLLLRRCFDSIRWFAAPVHKLAFQSSRCESDACRHLRDDASVGRHVAVGQLQGQIWLYLQNHNRYWKMWPWDQMNLLVT